MLYSVGSIAFILLPPIACSFIIYIGYDTTIVLQIIFQSIAQVDSCKCKHIFKYNILLVEIFCNNSIAINCWQGGGCSSARLRIQKQGAEGGRKVDFSQKNERAISHYKNGWSVLA